LILALDLYVRSEGNPPGKSTPEIVEIATGGSHEIDYRNPNGIYMKLMNFRRFDPVYRAQGQTGLTRNNKLEEAVWNEFADAPDRLTNTASAIVANLDDDANISYDYEISGIEEAEEGRVLTRAHLVRERSRKLVEAKKAECLRAAGKLTCEACDFDFKQTYGQRGDGFIEVHHSLPVHQLLPGTKTKLADLHLVCANCHRMIHARRPWLSMIELKACLDSPL
jgi:5-methylcytosine-specific restriction protein A